MLILVSSSGHEICLHTGSSGLDDYDRAELYQIDSVYADGHELERLQELGLLPKNTGRSVETDDCDLIVDALQHRFAETLG
jgi:hypothetical protein